MQQDTKGRKSKAKQKARTDMESQSAMEYMTTHAWMILIISVVVIALFGSESSRGWELPRAATSAPRCRDTSAESCHFPLLEL